MQAGTLHQAHHAAKPGNAVDDYGQPARKLR